MAYVVPLRVGPERARRAGDITGRTALGQYPGHALVRDTAPARAWLTSHLPTPGQRSRLVAGAAELTARIDRRFSRRSHCPYSRCAWGGQPGHWPGTAQGLHRL